MQWHGDRETESIENLHWPFCTFKYRKAITHEWWRIKWPPFHKKSSYSKIPNHWPPRVWVSAFPSVYINRKLASAIMQKWKNGHHFVKNHHTAKFQITDPQWFQHLENQRPKLSAGVGISNLKFFCMTHIYKMAAIFGFFFYNNQCQYFVSQMQIFNWFSFPIQFPHSNLMMFLCLKHLCVHIHVWWTFCT